MPSKVRFYQSVPVVPKRGLGTQVVVFSVIVVCVVAAIGVVSLTQPEATSTSSSEGTSPARSTTSTVEATTCAPSPGEAGNASVTITQTVGQWPPCACALVDSNSNGTLYVSTNAVVGDDVCIAASMSASPIVSFKVIGPTGGVFLPTGGCVNSAGTAVSCAASWNTAQLYPGGSQVQPGDYELIATGDLQSLRANFTLSGFVTGTSVNTTSDTFLTQCSVTGVGGFQFRVISDSTGAAVSGEAINATDRLGCDIVGQAPETQVVYLDNFSVGQGGWLTPVFPYQATPGGGLNFTVSYQGGTYNFSAVVPPIGTSCVTLRVPSGSVTTTTVSNGGPCS